MKAKVIIAQATAETVGFLHELVKGMAEKNGYQGLSECGLSSRVFPVDKHDLSFVKQVLADRNFSFKVENAE